MAEWLGLANKQLLLYRTMAVVLGGAPPVLPDGIQDTWSASSTASSLIMWTACLFQRCGSTWPAIHHFRFHKWVPAACHSSICHGIPNVALLQYVVTSIVTPLTVYDPLQCVWQPPYVDLLVGQHGVNHTQDHSLVDALQQQQHFVILCASDICDKDANI
jgi:hypothetical protein